jgi:hypothetical protein
MTTLPSVHWSPWKLMIIPRLPVSKICKVNILKISNGAWNSMQEISYALLFKQGGIAITTPLPAHKKSCLSSGFN